MSPIVHNDRDSFEVRNMASDLKDADQPTLLAEVGDWRTTNGVVTGVSFSTFGDVSPILSPTEARKLAKWLQKVADDMEGAKTNRDRPGSKRSHYELDDET